MSLTIPQASQAGLFKQGYNSYDAEDGAVIRNVNLATFDVNIQKLM
jgi:T-complex protein 1 subunit theta